jgi:hypothetical protein
MQQQSGLSYAGMTQIRFEEYFSAAGGGTSSWRRLLRSFSRL